MKKIKLLLAVSLLSATFAYTSYAGSWQQDSNGYWYSNDDGSYPINCWMWIDGNSDGVSENYYFDENGYCLFDTITPDGYTVDENGAMVIDDVVQTLIANADTPSTAAAESSGNSDSLNQSQASVQSQESGISSVPYDGYTLIVNTNTKKYHYPTCSSVEDINEQNKGYCSDASYLNSIGYTACKRCH